MILLMSIFLFVKFLKNILVNGSINTENVKKRKRVKMKLPDKLAPFLELLHIYRETG